MQLNSCEGPESFERMYPNLVDDFLKNHFPAAVLRNAMFRASVVAGLWLGLVTRENTEQASTLLRSAIMRGAEPGAAAVSVATGLGWVAGMVVEDAEESALGAVVN